MDKISAQLKARKIEISQAVRQVTEQMGEVIRWKNKLSINEQPEPKAQTPPPIKRPTLQQHFENLSNALL